MFKNYLSDYRSSYELAARIQDYWHKRNYTWIKVWTERDEMNNYVVRSNLSFKVK